MLPGGQSYEATHVDSQLNDRTGFDLRKHRHARHERARMNSAKHQIADRTIGHLARYPPGPAVVHPTDTARQVKPYGHQMRPYGEKSISHPLSAKQSSVLTRILFSASPPQLGCEAGRVESGIATSMPWDRLPSRLPSKASYLSEFRHFGSGHPTRREVHNVANWDQNAQVPEQWMTTRSAS